ncbi:hypothetical protein Hesp01_16400 [Herbidospora sp. NBRC 101105]|nr:hypothetical protein Hesp01_16400 [Herbidospora sp. NBRC 101105]
MTSTYGAISQNATRPVWVTLPVVTSTNQGMAIAETRVPVWAIREAANRPATGRHERVMTAPAGSG